MWDWANLFCGIYGVRPSATKSDFSKSPWLKKAFCVNVGLAKPIFIGKIYFYRPNPFLLVESDFFPKKFFAQKTFLNILIFLTIFLTSGISYCKIYRNIHKKTLYTSNRGTRSEECI